MREVGRPRRPRLDADRGRRADVAELKRLLPSAPAPFLEGALHNPEMSVDEMSLLLRNRAATPYLLLAIAQNRRWSRHYDVKKGLVRHARTPVPVARNLVHHLYWRDLAEAADDARVHPSVRRQAEALLGVRLVELTVGERISLARIATKGLIASLRDCSEQPVLEALLGNPRLVEWDVVQIAAGEEVPGAVLGRLAGHPVWGRRHAVRLALVNNPRTPIPAALGLVRRLPRPDLRRLAKDRGTPKIVRMGADRQLVRLARPGSRSEPPSPAGERSA